MHGECEDSSLVTSGFNSVEDSEVEGGRERRVHEESTPNWRGRGRARTAQGEDTSREEHGNGHQTLAAGQSVSRKTHAFGMRGQCLWHPDYM